MGKVVSGNFKFGDVTVDYDFQAMGEQRNECFFRMKFNKVPLEPETVFTAGLHLMHYLADNYGYRLLIKDHIPKLPSEEDSFEAAEEHLRTKKDGKH